MFTEVLRSLPPIFLKRQLTIISIITKGMPMNKANNYPHTPNTDVKLFVNVPIALTPTPAIYSKSKTTYKYLCNFIFGLTER
jgi:hypothetical protein